eukprot:gene3492-6140_t
MSKKKTLDAECEKFSEDFKTMWRSPLNKTPVCKDIGRLLSHITILKEEEFVFNKIESYQIDEDDSDSSKLIHFLNTISLLLNPSFDSTKIKDTLMMFYLQNKKQTKEEILIDESKPKPEKYEPKLITTNVFNENWEVKQEKSLENFFLTVYGEEHPIIKILKLCHQSIVICYLGFFSEILWDALGIRYKDSKKQPWNVFIKFHDGESSSRPDFVSVSHERTEQCMKPDSKFTSFSNLFIFSWNVEIQFDSYSFNNLYSISGKLGEIDWNDDELKLSQKEKKKLETSFSQLYSSPFYLFPKEKSEIDLEDDLFNKIEKMKQQGQSTSKKGFFIQSVDGETMDDEKKQCIIS